MLSLQVKTIRSAKKMSINELAEKAGYEPSTIRRIENGTFLPDEGRDIALANALGVSLNQLWGRKKFEDFFDNGQPKLREYEKVTLTLIAPIYKALSREGREKLLTAAETILLAEDAEAEWDTYKKTDKEQDEAKCKKMP